MWLNKFLGREVHDEMKTTNAKNLKENVDDFCKSLSSFDITFVSIHITGSERILFKESEARILEEKTERYRLQYYKPDYKAIKKIEMHIYLQGNVKD